jgi:hypothetical protein
MQPNLPVAASVVLELAYAYTPAGTFEPVDIYVNVDGPASDRGISTKFAADTQKSDEQQWNSRPLAFHLDKIVTGAPTMHSSKWIDHTEQSRPALMADSTERTNPIHGEADSSRRHS